VPFLVQWKGRLPAGTTYDLPVTNIDVMPTVLAAAGKPVGQADKNGGRIDGVDLVPFLSGASAGRPHETLFWRFGSQWAARKGDWKLVVSKGGSGRPELYDLAADPGEKTDRAGSEPARVAELQALYNAWNVEQATPIVADREKTAKKNRKGKPGRRPGKKPAATVPAEVAS
jgi:arylsulfatase A-like enzyme